MMKHLNSSYPNHCKHLIKILGKVYSNNKKIKSKDFEKFMEQEEEFLMKSYEFFESEIIKISRNTVSYDNFCFFMFIASSDPL